MIIDRIFSLVNQCTLEPKWEAQVATASNILHPKFAFERQADGSFIVEPRDASKPQHYLYEIQLKQVKGKYTMVVVLNRNPIIYVDIFLALIFAYLLFVSVIVLNPLPLFIYIVPLAAIAFQQKVVCHFIFNDVEYALFKAEYKPKQ